MHQAEQFLAALDSINNKFLFVTFDDSKSKEYNLTRTFYGTFEQHKATLTELNEAGAGVFVTVNKTAGNRRKKEDIIQARAIWQEDDTGTSLLPELPPSVVVESSPGHFHRYWLTELDLTTTGALTSWEKVQLAMVRNFGSDPNAKDVSRVLRLPGFYNNKRSIRALVKLVDCSGISYLWEELAASITGVQPEGAQTSQEETPQEESTLDHYLQQIITGQHLHGPIRAIMMINANKGHDRSYNKLMLTGLINTWSGEQHRKDKALQDLDSMLTATYRKVADENVDVVRPADLAPRQTPSGDISWPPGLMGELAQAANDFFVIPNKTVAIMTALSLIAGITGRRYNISSSGLNLYTTIMMPTGAGKDSIRKFCQRVLMDEQLLGTNGLAFLGDQNYTGPKALLGRLHTNPAMLCVMTEAGLLYKTDAGDKNGLTRVILQAYTSSGAYEFINSEVYSAKADNIPMIFAPALTILNEATPVTLLNELKRRESINTGELPRMWIFMLTGKKPYPNLDPHQLNLAPELAKSIKALISDSYTVQNSERPKVHNLNLPSGYPAYVKWCTDRYNELQEEDMNRAIMYTRAAHKVLKTAAVISVFNAATSYTALGPDSSPPPVTDEAFEWAKSLFEHEMRHIGPILQPNSPIDDAVDAASDIIYKLLHGYYTGRNKYVDPRARELGMFTESAFKQAATNISAIKDLGTSAKYGSPQSGVMIVLKYMAQEGLLDHVTNVRWMRKGTKGYSITNYFRDRFNVDDIDDIDDAK